MTSKIQVQKKTEDGLGLFLLPQKPREVEYETFQDVKTPTVTERPVFVTVNVPQLDEDGKQRAYELTTTEVDEEGNTVQVGTGQFNLLWVINTVQEELDGKPLYWLTEVKKNIRLEPQDPIEITEEDERYTEDLEPSYEWVEVEVPAEPTPAPLPPTADQRITALETLNLTLKQDNIKLKEQVASLSGDLQALIDYILSQ